MLSPQKALSCSSWKENSHFIHCRERLPLVVSYTCNFSAPFSGRLDALWHQTASYRWERQRKKKRERERDLLFVQNGIGLFQGILKEKNKRGLNGFMHFIGMTFNGIKLERTQFCNCVVVNIYFWMIPIVVRKFDWRGSVTSCEYDLQNTLWTTFTVLC